MKIIQKIISFLTYLTKYLALATITFMMFFITVAVIGRLFSKPIVGDIAVVQLSMVALIACGLAYAQQSESHISIGIVVDKFPNNLQKVFDVIAYLFVAVVTIMIAYIYVGVGLNHKNNMVLSTNLLEIPYFPFDFLIVAGLFIWGRQALLNAIEVIIELTTKRTNH